VSRTLAMQKRYFEGQVQPLSNSPTAEDIALRNAFDAARQEMETHMQAFAFHRALEAVWRAIDHVNRYIVETAPFTLAKDPAQRPRVGEILHNVLDALHATTVLIDPFLPESAQRIWQLLGLPGRPSLDGAAPWGTAFPAGHSTAPPEVLFPRIEITPRE